MFVSGRSILAFGALLGLPQLPAVRMATTAFASCSTSTTATFTTSTTTQPTTVVVMSTSTNVATQTNTRTIYSPVAPNKRYIAVQQQTASATAIPAYASACSGAVTYSSACSCIGVTRYTVTLATASTTTSSTSGVVQTSVILTTVASTTTQFTSTTVSTSSTATTTKYLPPVCNAGGLPGANAFNYDANFNTNQAACKASCVSDSRCLSTGFYLVTDPTTGTTTGTCRKYDKSVTDSADLGFGYYNFNDKYCL